jgi:hypothetical protein
LTVKEVNILKGAKFVLILLPPSPFEIPPSSFLLPVRLPSSLLALAPLCCPLFLARLPPAPPSQGDGITLCGKASREEAAKEVNPGYGLRGTIALRRLDDVLAPLARDVQVLKMDVEGGRGGGAGPRVQV